MSDRKVWGIVGIVFGFVSLDFALQYHDWGMLLCGLTSILGSVILIVFTNKERP